MTTTSTLYMISSDFQKLAGYICSGGHFNSFKTRDVFWRQTATDFMIFFVSVTSCACERTSNPFSSGE